MENSFFEYASDLEIIDNSYLEESLPPKKTPAKKNQTVYVPESDDDFSEVDSYEADVNNKSVHKTSNINQPPLVLRSSSDDDAKKKNGGKREPDSPERSSEVLSERSSEISSSEDEGQASPEMVPRRRPRISSARLSGSFIGQRKKRMMIIDSDTDNSIVIEHNKNRKLKCLKDTPLKVDLRRAKDVKNMSLESDSNEVSSDEETNGEEKDDDKHSSPEDKDGSSCEEKGKENDDSDKSDCLDEISRDETASSRSTKRSTSKVDSSVDENRINNYKYESKVDDNNSDKNVNDTESDEQDEDVMVMSRATRMSIMGIIPKENDSDDSDYIQSDSSQSTSRSASASSLPEVKVKEMTIIDNENNDVTDASRLTCSPFTSPFRDITNVDKVGKPENDICDLTQIDSYDMKSKVNRLSKVNRAKYVKEVVIDDDVTIIDSKPEVIAVSSDDDDEVRPVKSPNIKKSPKVKKEEPRKMESGIKQYLVPASYPNQVVYVKKHVREAELDKLSGLKEDLQNIRYLLENMDADSLPDGGVKMIQRLTELEEQVRLQGDKVANMVVDTEDPADPEVIEINEKENRGLSWDDIQKASNAVQPRMFGKQAMTTHMAERNLILERLRDLYESLKSRPAEGERAEAPAALRSSLMEHQLHALAWLRWRETQRPPGGILADDMGLGKTITMISLVAGDRERVGEDDDDDDDGRKSRLVGGGTLVVCPASLVQQWSGEVSKHCAAHSLAVCLHHGAARATQPHRLAPHDLVITTYNILQRETEKAGALTRVRWRRVILDEAHVVRNHKSATSAAVSALHGRRRWALTGTPLHNKDLDLFALLKFLRCTPFDDLTMWKKWIDNKSLGGQERLNTIMRCVMLRRTKAQLQERGQLGCLPARTAHERPVTLHQDEMNVYQKVLVFSKTLFAQFLHQRAEKQADAMGFAGSTAKKDSAYHKMHKRMIALQGAKPVKSHEILVLLLRLRQVCCHCGLIAAMLDDSGDGDVVEDEGSKDLLAELNKLTLEDSRSKRKSKQDDDEDEDDDGGAEGTTVTEAIRSVLSPRNPVFDLGRRSSKIGAVMACLNDDVLSKPGEKAVVVSQWTSVLSLVERELRAAGVGCVTLSGGVPVPARAALVTALNDPASPVRVMLLSLCAGGVGLNLCGANHLLLLDPHWNPQLEHQAQDRIYRVGQNKPVHIYRFMCVDTVEQSIRQIQQAKLEMAENVLTGARNNASKLTIEDLRVLFNMGSQGGA